MGKTRHRINKEEVERESEAPAHRRRREFKQHLQKINYDDALLEEEEELTERHQRIRRPRKQK